MGLGSLQWEEGGGLRGALRYGPAMFTIQFLFLLYGFNENRIGFGWLGGGGHAV